MFRTKWYIAIFCVVSTSIILSIVIIEIDHLLTLNPSEKVNNDDLEENRIFWAYNYVNEEYYQVNSSLLGVGDYCYIYMDE